jgi:hypothetical protein
MPHSGDRERDSNVTKRKLITEKVASFETVISPGLAN